MQLTSTGTIERTPGTRGIRLIRGLFNRVVHCVARYVPMYPGMRVALHRLRGVKVGRECFIGIEVFIDDSYPELVRIEDRVTILVGAVILAHGFYSRHFQNVLPDTAEPVTVEEGAYVGARAIVLPGVTVGRFSVVAAGAVVTKDVPPYTLVAGVPARPIREFDPSQIDCGSGG